jgi:hypothetical protein
MKSKVKVNLSLWSTKYNFLKTYLHNQAPRHEDVVGSGGTALRVPMEHGSNVRTAELVVYR